MIHDILLYGGGTALGMLIAFLPLFWSRLKPGKH
jgi:hypothetical protein